MQPGLPPGRPPHPSPTERHNNRLHERKWISEPRHEVLIPSNKTYPDTLGDVMTRSGASLSLSIRARGAFCVRGRRCERGRYGS